MEINSFIRLIEEEFEEIEPGSLTENDNFKDVLSWSSMNILLLLAKIKEELGVDLTIGELSDSKNFKELFDLIVSRKPNT